MQETFSPLRIRQHYFFPCGRMQPSQRKGSGVHMMMETYLRRGRRSLQRMALDPRVRRISAVTAFAGSGFLLSAAGLSGLPQPLAMGLICAATGWRALVLSLGAMAGYPAFWGSAGNPGIVWAAAAGLLALLLGKREEAKQQPLMIPAIAAFLTGVTGVSFRFFLRAPLDILPLCLQMAGAFLSGALFTRTARCRDAVTDWLAMGLGVLALARVNLGPLGLGYGAAGLLAVYGAFPAAALAGLALDLSEVTAVPMGAVMCLAWFLRMVPFDKRWQHYAAPGGACILVMAACGIRDPAPLPGLFLGGALGALLPPQPAYPLRRGETGAAQVRLELGAEVLRTMEVLVQEMEPPPVDAEALLSSAVERACGGCSLRRHCQQREELKLYHLENPLDADCRKQGRLIPELRRAREQLRSAGADRQRQKEYRQALAQQYRFLYLYLRNLADRLPRRGEVLQPEFRVEAAARSRGKERVNGDLCTAFSGSDCRYFVLLCDGMGTGPGAAREGQTAMQLLRRMLSAGFPAEHALKSLNSLLALRGLAGAVTVDLAEICLDTGHVRLSKWGAAPSWVLTRGKAEKIGTATPPPGLSPEGPCGAVERLSLRRGEVLILLSDGAENGEDLRLSELSVDLPPGELAEQILQRVRDAGEDDVTAAVIRLVPMGP